MAFSFSGRVQNRLVNGHGEFMDAVTILALRGKKRRAFPQCKLETTEK
jgi:hypothetical protein